MPPFTLHPVALHCRPSTPPPVTLHSASLYPSLLHPYCALYLNICSCIVVISCSEERCDMVTVSSPGEAHGRTRPNEGPVMDERPVSLCRLPGVARCIPPTFAPALHCAALHSSPRRPSLPPVDSAARHPSFRLSSPLTPAPFTPTLHHAALCPSIRHASPPPPPPTAPLHTAAPHSAALAPPVACHDLCDFRIVRVNLG
jgi:hypothetical protein